LYFTEEVKRSLKRSEEALIAFEKEVKKVKKSRELTDNSRTYVCS